MTYNIQIGSWVALKKRKPPPENGCAISLDEHYWYYSPKDKDYNPKLSVRNTWVQHHKCDDSNGREGECIHFPWKNSNFGFGDRDYATSLYPFCQLTSKIILVLQLYSTHSL